MKSTTNSFTLLEVTITVALWMILSISALAVWQHAARSGGNIILRQSAFENARASMDALIINIQLASTIELITCHNNILQLLTLTERDPQGRLHNYTFRFDINAPPGAARHRRLIFGLNNEFASGIAKIQMSAANNSRMNILVKTDCEYPIILEGSVDIRYKSVTTIQR